MLIKQMKDILKEVQALQNLIQRGQNTMAKNARRRHQGLYPSSLYSHPTILVECLQCTWHCPRYQRFMELLCGHRVFNNHTNECIITNEKTLRENPPCYERAENEEENWRPDPIYGVQEGFLVEVIIKLDSIAGRGGSHL